MREIKFRAWDKRNKKMLFFNEAWVCQEYRSLAFWNSDEDIDYYKDLESYKFSEDKINDLELQQFTGLLDKNGKEIYEGDIITDIKLKTKILFTIDFGFATKDDGYGVIVWSPKSGESYNITKEFCERGEVIGNVYENKDLLT
ncbi:YopX family protein [Candidatus Dojkabacteria bacterium]|jgi:uncharacterized phage protein (TIGR01671 family)|nr:YopX family protein [Candidatus Dojkabacteria bacterium]